MGSYGSFTREHRVALGFRPDVLWVACNGVVLLQTVSMQGRAKSLGVGEALIDAGVELGPDGFTLSAGGVVAPDAGSQCLWFAASTADGALRIGQYRGDGGMQLVFGLGLDITGLLVLPEGPRQAATSGASPTGAVRGLFTGVPFAFIGCSTSDCGLQVTVGELNQPDVEHHWLAWSSRSAGEGQYVGSGVASVVRGPLPAPDWLFIASWSGGSAVASINQPGSTYSSLGGGAFANGVVALGQDGGVALGTDPRVNTSGRTYAVFGFIRTDAGTLDAGIPDAGAVDAGAVDAGPPDASLPDAGLPDAGLPDAGLPDASLPDASLPDASLPDASLPDAGLPDASLPDASTRDAGDSDAGSSDAGAVRGGPSDDPARSSFLVGCGCSAGSVSFVEGLFLLILSLRPQRTCARRRNRD